MNLGGRGRWSPIGWEEKKVSFLTRGEEGLIFDGRKRFSYLSERERVSHLSK